MLKFLTHIAVIAIALFVATAILPGIHIDTIPALLVAALALGFINAIVRPVLLILTLPITLVTLGLFYLVVNGAAFALAAYIVPGFGVDSFWSAMVGAIVVGIISWFVGIFIRSDDRKTDPS